MKAIFDAINLGQVRLFPSKTGAKNQFYATVTDPETGKRYFMNLVPDASKLNADGTPTYGWVRGQELQAQTK